MKRAQGFTLMELVVAITISSIVIIFVSMFLSAPIDAYDAHARRNVLVADAAAAWPRMEADLRQALPNSVRTTRNGAFVALELLRVEGEARYIPPLDTSFQTAGTLPALSNSYLSVNNLGTPGRDAYAPGNTMTPASTTITITPGVLGESLVGLNVAPTFLADSPRRRLYLVSGPVTYLCDEGLGTLRRYEGYPLAALQTARDEPGDFSVAGTLIARGLSSCNFAVSGFSVTQAQTVAVRLTTTRNAESIALLHTVRAEYVP